MPKKRDEPPAVRARVESVSSTPRARKQYNSKWSSVVKMVLALPPTKRVCLEVPKGKDASSYRSTVRSAMSYQLKGTGVRVRVEKLEDGRVAITKIAGRRR